MLKTLLSRPDTKWVLTTFSVMGFLNLASRMAVVYKSAGVVAVGLAFIGIGGWIHGIASVARSAQKCSGRRSLPLLCLLFFGAGCLLALPWHFFTFDDIPSSHPGFYLLAQSLAAMFYVMSRWVQPDSFKSWVTRHLILGYATFACLFQSVAPKVGSAWLRQAAHLDLTMAFVGSSLLILAIISADVLTAVMRETAKRAPVRPRRS